MSGVEESVKGRSDRRPYDTTTRRAASRATRERILESARELLLERGYRATTVADIAESAEVNVDTVYRLVGRKATVLRELIEQAISGADDPVAPEDRDYVRRMRTEQDQATKLRIYATATREIQARMAPLLVALRDAAATEPDAAEVWREISDRRAANMRRLAADLASERGLRAGLSIDDAADAIWVTNSSEVYLLLTTERRWTPDRYESWLAETWIRLLLPDPGSAEPSGAPGESA
jgi:AcrR family transcriptional regulator